MFHLEQKHAPQFLEQEVCGPHLETAAAVVPLTSQAPGLS